MVNTTLAPGWLAGRIVDREGRPLPDARVMTWTYSPQGRAAVRADGDADGRFRLGPLPASVHQVIWCEAPGCARLRIGDDEAPEIAVFPDATNELGNIELAEETVAVGKVLDTDGLPIAGATITLTPYYNQLSGTIASNGEPLEVRTDEGGTFGFESLASGTAHVVVAVPDFPRLRTGARIAATDRRIDFGTLQFDRARTEVQGTVTDRRGQPVAGARVSANEDHEAYATTDEAGRFRLLARTARVDHVAVTHPASPQRSRVRVEDPSDIHVMFELARVLEGRVRDAETGQVVKITDVKVCEVMRRALDGTITLVG